MALHLGHLEDEILQASSSAWSSFSLHKYELKRGPVAGPPASNFHSVPEPSYKWLQKKWLAWDLRVEE